MWRMRKEKIKDGKYKFVFDVPEHTVRVLRQPDANNDAVFELIKEEMRSAIRVNDEIVADVIQIQLSLDDIIQGAKTLPDGSTLNIALEFCIT